MDRRTGPRGSPRKRRAGRPASSCSANRIAARAAPCGPASWRRGADTGSCAMRICPCRRRSCPAFCRRRNGVRRGDWQPRGRRIAARGRAVPAPHYGPRFNYVIQCWWRPASATRSADSRCSRPTACRAIFPHTTLDGWAFDVEVLSIARALGLRIVEVPIEWHHRKESQVSVLRDSWRMLRDVLKVRARVRRNSLLRRQG